MAAPWRPSVLVALFMGTIGMVLLQLPTAVALIGIEAFARARHLPAVDASPPYLFLEMALTGLTIVLVLALLRGLSFPIMRERYGLRWPAISGATFAIAAVGMFALAIETVALSRVLERFHWLPAIPASSLTHALGEALRHGSIATRVILALSLGIFPGVSEELMFRGQVQRALLARWSPLAAILVTSAMFALIHVSPGRYLTTFTFAFWVGWIAWRSGSIVPGMLLHALNNSVFAGVEALGSALGPHRPEHVPPAPVPTATLLAVAMTGLAVSALCTHLLAARLPLPPARGTPWTGA